MNIWITKNSEFPVREQLALQITLGIAGGDLTAGSRLPSTREIARRFDLHSNTVSAAYRTLVDARMVEFRKGSGYFVSPAAFERIGRRQKLRTLIDALLKESQTLGFSGGEVTEQLKRVVDGRISHRLRLIEPDLELRNILAFELRSAGFQVSSSGIEFFDEPASTDELITAMFDEQYGIEKTAFAPERCVYLRGRSVASSLASEDRPSATDVLAVISVWDGFLSMAKVILLAANIPPGNLIVRSARTDGWEDVVNTASVIITDPLTATKLNNTTKIRIFRIISDESLMEVRDALEGNPSRSRIMHSDSTRKDKTRI